MAKLIKRPAGPKKLQGETQKDIVSILIRLEREEPELNEYANAFQSILQFRIKEPELVEIIRKKLDIHDKKVISDHLVKLCKKGELIKYAKDNKGNSIRLSERTKIHKTTTENENEWEIKIDPNITGNENEWEIDQESFKQIARRFLGKKDELIFLQSNYAKKWVEHNAFNEFITNFGIDLKAIQEIMKSFPNNQRISYLERLRTELSQILSFSPSALKFILDTKVDNIKERIKTLAILNESSLAVKYRFNFQIEEDIFVDKYGAKKDFNTLQISLNNPYGWAMLQYWEFSIKMLKNELFKDFFRYPDFYLEQTLPFTISFGEHMFKALRACSK